MSPVDEVLAQLDSLADAQTAEILSRFFQVRPGGYGEGDIFIGIKLSVLRGVAKPYLREPYESARWLPLLQSPVHEHRQLALVVMSERAGRSRKGAGGGGESAQIYAEYLDHTRFVNNWDLVDLSAGPIVGGHLLDRDRAPLFRLAASTVLWERRIAIVASQRFLKAGDSADLYRLAELLLDDRHDLMHKAVGWSLREAGKRVDRDELRAFLDRHAATMPRTTLRYAIEHFDADERRHYLGLRKSRGDLPADRLRLSTDRVSRRVTRKRAVGCLVR